MKLVGVKFNDRVDTKSGEFKSSRVLYFEYPIFDNGHGVQFGQQFVSKSLFDHCGISDADLIEAIDNGFDVVLETLNNNGFVQTVGVKIFKG